MLARPEAREGFLTSLRRFDDYIAELGGRLDTGQGLSQA
jgi:hypothetical protein